MSTLRITAQNLEMLRDAVADLNTAWDNIEGSVEIWLEYQTDQPTDADGRDAKREAREEIDGGIDDITSAIDALASLTTDRTARSRK